MNLVALPYDEKTFSVVWPVVVGVLSPVLSDVTADDVLARLQDGTAQLWAVAEGSKIIAACVTEIAGDKCNIWKHAALRSVVKRVDWRAHADDIAAWAREQGCRRIAIEGGRRGWMKVFHDWQLVSVELERAL